MVCLKGAKNPRHGDQRHRASDGALQPLRRLASNHLLLHRLLKVENHLQRLLSMKSYVTQADPDPPRPLCECGQDPPDPEAGQEHHHRVAPHLAFV